MLRVIRFVLVVVGTAVLGFCGAYFGLMAGWVTLTALGFSAPTGMTVGLLTGIVVGTTLGLAVSRWFMGVR